MLKHPISAFLRSLPALSWLAAFGVVLWTFLSLFVSLYSQGRWMKAWLDVFMLLGFVAVAIYTARMAYKEFREALPALRADKPVRLGMSLPGRQKPFVPTRYPLADDLRAELRALIETLQSAGMLLPEEVTIEEVIDHAEVVDEWSEVDLYMAMNVLYALQGERRRAFANIVFFETHVETDESDAVSIVEKLVRLRGRSHELSTVRVRSIDGGKIVPARSGSSPPNAVAEFELGTEHHAVPFVLYGKSIPGGLIEALAKILTSADDPRRFVWDNFDSFFSVSVLTSTQVAIVNSAEQREFPRFEEVR